METISSLEFLQLLVVGRHVSAITFALMHSSESDFITFACSDLVIVVNRFPVSQ